MDYPGNQIRSSQKNGPIESNPSEKRSKACMSCRTRKVKCDANVVGLPCSSCTSRQCPETCVLSRRKPRRRKLDAVATTEKSRRSRGTVTPSICPSDQLLESGSGPRSRPIEPNSIDIIKTTHSRDDQSESDCQRPHRARPDLPYLTMIQDAVNNAPPVQHLDINGGLPPIASHGDNNHLGSWFGSRPNGLDDVDYEYLVKKGVFELPAQPYLDKLVRTYFEYLWPFAPVIQRTEFIQKYRAGSCSLFLLYAMLATAVPFAPEDAISGLGFPNRSVAQTSLFCKARLLCDFHCERDLLAMLQGSIVLSVIILDHPTDKDFQHWYYNSVRLFVKLDLHDICARQEGACKQRKLYRRIWWVLYVRDVFHSFVNTKNLRLVETLPYIQSITKDDWDEEDTLESPELLYQVSDQQKISLVAHCELAQLFSTPLLYTTTDASRHDPQKLMLLLDEWRVSLRERMGIRNTSYNEEAYYPEVIARSYLFECIFCRHLRRQQDAKWGTWAKQRLRSAIFELDAIVGRILAGETIKKFPMGFVATVPALLALHIEAALDLSETDLVRCMARVSINQTMLALGQMQHVPAIKRGLPSFELVLAKKDLYSGTGCSYVEKNSPKMPTVGQNDCSLTQPDLTSVEAGPADYPSFPDDFLGYDFLDRWQLEQWDFVNV